MADTALRSQREPPPISACQGRVDVFRAPYLEDILCAIPALRAPRNDCHSTHITSIGLPWTLEIATRFPEYVDDFLPFLGHPQLPESPATRTEYCQFVNSFRFPEIDVSTLQDVAEIARFALLQPAETVIPEIMVIPMRETS